MQVLTTGSSSASEQICPLQPPIMHPGPSYACADVEDEDDEPSEEREEEESTEDESELCDDGKERDDENPYEESAS